MKEQIIRDFTDRFGYSGRLDSNVKLEDVELWLDQFVDLEVERRIAERMPTVKGIEDEAFKRQDRLLKRNSLEGCEIASRIIGFVMGAKWFRSRMKGQ